MLDDTQAQWRCGLERRQGRQLQFSYVHCKFPTEVIIGAQDFNFAPKFLLYGTFNCIFEIFGRKFPVTKRIFKHFLLTAKNLGWPIVFQPSP